MEAANSVRNFRHATMRFRPSRRIVDKFFHLHQHLRIEFLARFGDGKHVMPCGQIMECHADVGEDFPPFGIDVIEKKHGAMLANTTGVADRFDEINLAASICCQVFDQQYALTRN